jgi:hypothetical protein
VKASLNLYSREVEIPTYELECECFIAHEHEEKTENHELKMTKEHFDSLATERFEKIEKIRIDYCRYALQRILRIFNNPWIESCKHLV